jgi:hypothetical protein
MQNGYATGMVAELVEQNQYLRGQDPSVRHSIFEKATWVSEALGAWAAPYALIRTVRTYPLALSVSAAAPFENRLELLNTARVNLWVFTLDDLFDEEGLPPAVLLERAASYRAIAHGEPLADASDPLALALGEVMSGLATYPLFQVLREEWANALCRTIDGMVQEHRWRLAYRRDGLAALPAYEEYVENGLKSVGGPPYVWSAIITTGDASVPWHLRHLREMERVASTCVRLANDLQSFTKEIAEEKPNSLLIVRQAMIRRGLAPEDALHEAQISIQAAITRELADLDSLEAQARTRTGRPEAVTANIARFVCEFYARYDYHTFAKETQPGGLRDN